VLEVRVLKERGTEASKANRRRLKGGDYVTFPCSSHKQRNRDLVSRKEAYVEKIISITALAKQRTT
jgi:hypothetical protein